MVMSTALAVVAESVPPSSMGNSAGATAVSQDIAVAVADVESSPVDPTAAAGLMDTPVS